MVTELGGSAALGQAGGGSIMRDKLPGGVAGQGHMGNSGLWMLKELERGDF